MTNGIKAEIGGNPIVIIYVAVIISMIVMLSFARQISDFINNRPTIKMIALSFLVTIGVILVAEAFGQHVPKGYIYFAMVFSLIVEFLNIRMRKNKGLE
jgi:predicted tellurium resistance membrane protein TerC